LKPVRIIESQSSLPKTDPDQARNTALVSTAKDVSGDNQLLDFVSPFIDFANFAVPVNGFQRVLLPSIGQFLDKTIAATHLYGITGQIAGQAAANQLSHCTLLGNTLAPPILG